MKKYDFSLQIYTFLGLIELNARCVRTNCNSKNFKDIDLNKKCSRIQEFVKRCIQIKLFDLLLRTNRLNLLNFTCITHSKRNWIPLFNTVNQKKVD